MAEPVSTTVLLAKAATALLSNEKTRKGIGWIIAGILSPLIVLIALILSLFSIGSSQNSDMINLAFGNSPIGNLPAEYRQGIEDMRDIFNEIDEIASEINTENELDILRIQAIFYVLFYDETEEINLNNFVDCFYFVAETGEIFAQTDLDIVYQNISKAFDINIEISDMINADNVYLRVKYGSVVELPSEPPYVDENGYAEPVADWQNSVTSEFGRRIHPIYETPSMHYGIDLAKPQGTPIHSVLDGTVIAATYDNSYGYYIKIAHTDGFETLYAHCSRVYVDVGDEVSAGDKIGLVGSTGDSTGPHLHFETIQNGEYINPRAYLPIK